MGKFLEVKDLHVQYKTDESVVYALNGLTLDVEKGETVGLVGETGAGKTTLALSILKLLPEDVGKITKGSIYYNGTDVIAAGKNEMRRLRGEEISMIFQDPMTSLNPVLTVGEQIREVLVLHFPDMTKQEREKRVDEILTLVGIPPERKSQYPHQFSGGMKQRVVIAIALVAQPKLLLADEPTTALDVTIQAQILQLMKDLKQKLNTSMIFITHDLGVVMEFCDSVAVVYGGEVIERGTIEEIYVREKNHPYTEGLFNCIPDLGVDTHRLHPIEGEVLDPTLKPAGCKFADRCRYCRDNCKKSNPDMYHIGGTHFIKCYRYTDGEVQTNE
ncbi:MAG: ABC transporter ATP-binding protein [Acetatifactor sp.]|nr:ABC transporter ATP-binding protein [Acetatifactor sp.]